MARSLTDAPEDYQPAEINALIALPSASRNHTVNPSPILLEFA
jgi:hypothetical protein